MAQVTPRFLLVQNACQRTNFSCSSAFGCTELVFNVQTANFDNGKPFPAKISASRESTGKATRRFPTSFSAIPQNFARLV
ncbi:MAG: hypothetical protein M5U34_04645 [Chloroflexi bacterium]|nr:hypothetical protein [Chloroflexota bacterium]